MGEASQNSALLRVGSAQKRVVHGRKEILVIDRLLKKRFNGAGLVEERIADTHDDNWNQH